VPEGLPLAVTLALAFATTRMLKENNLVRVLRACETMGNATTICSDKTGTLTQNKMTVVAGTIGANEGFASSDHPTEKDTPTPTTLFTNLSRPVKELIRTSITLNSTAFEGEEKGVPTYIGSKTEVAMLSLAKDFLGLDHLATERANYKVKQLIPFDSGRKCMGMVIKYNHQYRLLVKGASEIMLSKASQIIADINSEKYSFEDITAEHKQHIDDTIEQYAQHSLRTIGMLYKDFPEWPPAKAKVLEEDPKMADFDDIFHDMIWVGVVGIHDPLRPGVTTAVAQCQQSGVVVRMVTGDNVTTAQAIAKECGILRPDEDGLVMEGPKFRQLTDQQMDEVLPRLRVLARSSPDDKRILVGRLKHLGETVAVTGDGTNDGPALKMADVGFSMGIAGTEVAKEASSIILLDDNFSSTITALMWGRAVNDAVKKFLQFQITVNITAVILTFVSSVSNSSNHSVLTAVQLLWVNLIMDTLAALALATDPPTPKILDRPPQPKSAPLITINMWKMITGQAIYQLVVTFILYFAGMDILSYEHTPERQEELNTVVFNTFVWMQIFNEFNNRRLDNKFNIFENIHKNFWFIGINCIMVGGQIMIIFVGGAAFQITRLDGPQWAISILCALPCLLWAVLVRLFPDHIFEIGFRAVVDTMTILLRPVFKGLRFVFHPVAQVFRACTRFIKRLFKKKSDDEETEETETRNSDEELGTPALVSANKPVNEIDDTSNEKPGTPPVPEFKVTAAD
jgi:P-type Ca2+ transporter type 2C